ncbi:hypothetical protein LUZ60_007694 [Juncus effusus]|nr:hypothetical protein LUZ60_007694 [Juncus effusus]
MANAALNCVERATSDMLIGPDWSINIELCDIINMNPAQTKDAIKALKKRLGNKNPKVQILALTALETLSKNCGDVVHQQIVERDILHEMVKIVKKKPDLAVKEKILVLIDTWQEAFGGPSGKYPLYHTAYRELRAAGMDFPPRIENAAPLFTPPQTVPLQHAPIHSTYEEAAIQASLQTEPPPMSKEDIQNAQGIADVLSEMLNAIDPAHPEGLKEEIIIDLVEQCRTNQRHIIDFLSNTGDESLLIQGLTLNDELQRVLKRHDELSKGSSASSAPLYQSSVSKQNILPPPTQYQSSGTRQNIPPPSGPATSANFSSPFVNVDQEDDEPEDDFSFLSRRTAREKEHNSSSQGKQQQSYVLPPPPISKNPIPHSKKESSPPIDLLTIPASKKESPSLDFLSGDNYLSDDEPILPPPPPPFLNENNNQDLPKAPWEMDKSQPSVSLPPPPSKYGQRQQYFDQQSSGGYNGMVSQTEGLLINEGVGGNASNNRGNVNVGNKKPEEALFKDLVDFARAKSSSPSSKPATSRRTR